MARSQRGADLRRIVGRTIVQNRAEIPDRGVLLHVHLHVSDSFFDSVFESLMLVQHRKQQIDFHKTLLLFRRDFLYAGDQIPLLLIH